jgi:hypothetical protein
MVTFETGAPVLTLELLLRSLERRFGERFRLDERPRVFGTIGTQRGSVEVLATGMRRFGGDWFGLVVRAPGECPGANAPGDMG